MGFAYTLGLWSSKVFFRLFYSVKFYGRENWIPGPSLVTASHASNYDPILVGIALAPHQLYYMAKEPLFRIPVLKQLIESFNAYPVSLNENDLRSIRRTYKLLQEEKQILIFPEGMRSFDGEFNPIKRGVGMITAHSQCSIIPVYIHGNFETWNRNQSLPRLFTEMAVVIGSPIRWDHFMDLPKREAQKKVCELVEKRLQLLKNWHEEGAEGSPP